MPEGHTIHRVARDHRKRYLGQQLSVTSPQGRFEDGAAELDQGTLDAIEAHGKHLFYHWRGSQCLHIHLGLFGRFRNYSSPPPTPRGAVRMRISGLSHAFDLVGPTACELLTHDACQTIRNRLGADPLRNDGDLDRLWKRISRSRAAIGKLLLDQSVIAGVGNVYRAEVLFALRIHPERLGKSISRNEFDDLWELLRDFLRIGVRYNRIITTDPKEFGKPASRLRKQERLLCYKKPRCVACNTKIEVWDLGNRTMYACPKCQK